MRTRIAICTLAALFGVARIAGAQAPAPPAAPSATPPAVASAVPPAASAAPAATPAPPPPPPQAPPPQARPGSIIVLPTEPAPDGLSVGIDDVGIPEGPGVPHTVTPGKHVVRVSAPGKQSWSTTVDVGADGAASLVTVPVLADAPMPAATTEGVPEKPRHRGGVALMIVGFSVGGTALAIGAVLGAGAISATNKLKNECPNKVCASDNTDYSTASSLAIGADIALPIAAIGIALGIAGVVVHSKTGGPETEPPPQTSLWLGPGSIGGTF